MANISLDIDNISKLIFDLVDKNAGNIELIHFFRLLHRLGLKGMGIGSGGDVTDSGEDYTIDYVRRALTQRYPGTPLTVFDVGANVGGFLKALTTVFKETPCRIWSFEPAAGTFTMLSAMAQEAGLGNVSLHNIGLGKEDGSLTLYSDRVGSAVASLYQRRMEHFGGLPLAGQEQVTLRSIDSFCAEQGVGRIHYLKMDVEGHEIDCLHGAGAMLDAGAIDFIQFEFGGANIDSRTFFQDFWYLLENYKISRIMKNGLFQIDKYTEFEEVFMVQNYLAERRSA